METADAFKSGLFQQPAPAPLDLIPREFGNTVKSLLQILICGDVVGHFSVVEFLISVHVEISCSCKAEYDGLFFAGLLALHGLVDSHLDSM